MINNLRFEIRDSALYAANTGRAFDRIGVISICRSNLSAKGRLPPQDEPWPDDALVAGLLEQRLETYRRDKNALREDANQEEEVSSDYSGRCLWELLQNADDAMAPSGSPSSELIGAKGLGFKSVLEVSDRPEIHSGSFSFGFDPERSARLLKQIAEAPPRLTFRLPHLVKSDLVVRRLLSQGFTTVVRLPFRDDGSEQLVIDRLSGLQPHFLLLSQHLATLDIRLPHARRLMQKAVARSKAREEVTLSLTTDGVRSSRRWRVWRRTWLSSIEGGKRLSAALAAPLDGRDDGPAADIPLHVFYPTEETLGASLLVHGSFDVSANRNNLRPGPNDREVLSTLADFARQAARELPPSLVIQLFAPLVRDRLRGVRLLAKKVVQALANAVTATAFIPTCGGGLVLPAETRTWSYGLGEVLMSAAKAAESARIAAPELARAFGLLEGAFHARPIGALEAARALTHVRCRSREDCIAAVRAAQGYCLAQAQSLGPVVEALARAPIWFTSDGEVRPLAGVRPFVEAPPDNWPLWLQADVIDASFLDALPTPDDGPPRKAWDDLLAHRLLRRPNDYLQHALAPTLGRWTADDWSEKGWEAFLLLDRWMEELEWGKIRPYVPGWSGEEPLRHALATVMHAPSKGAWAPTIEAYAGVENLGPDALVGFVRDNTNAPLVNRPKPAEQIGRARWRALLRFLGVSWEPKFREWSTNGHGPTKTAFLSDTEWSLRYPQPDWYLEHFPQCVVGAGAAAMTRMAESVLAAGAPLKGRWLKMWGAQTSHPPGRFASYVDWQLRTSRYLPCRPSLGHPGAVGAPGDLFWPDRGLRGITPELNLAGVREDRRPALRKLFKERLGVNVELPRDAEAWQAWADTLADGIANQPDRITLRIVRHFYDAYLSRDLASAGSPTKVVCETAGGMAPVAPTKAIWLDKAELAPSSVQAALVQAGLPVFPVHLERGIQAHTYWKVRRASAVVGISPRYAVDNPSRSAMLERRLEQRRRAVAAICETKGVVWNRNLSIKAVHDLQLEVHVGSLLVAERPTLAALLDGIWLLSLDGDEFDALSKACVEGLPHATDLRRRIAAILRAKPSEVASVLLEEGIPAYRMRELQLEEDLGEVDEEPNAGGLGDANEEETEDDEGEGGHPDRSSTLPPSEPLNPPAVPPAGLALRSLYGTTPSRPPTDVESRSRGGAKAAAAIAQVARDRGRAAEAWFAEALHNTLPPGWNVAFNLRDEADRESDVILSSRGQAWHIEVKALTSELFFWSELERQKAALHPGRYFMALLVADGSGGYRIHWCWDPQADLQTCERRLDWIWDSKSAGPALLPGLWKAAAGVSEPRRAPDRVDNVVRITEVQLAQLDSGDRLLNGLWARLKPARAKANADSYPV